MKIALLTLLSFTQLTPVFAAKGSLDNHHSMPIKASSQSTHEEASAFTSNKPTATSPIEYCVGAQAQPLTAILSDGASTLKWYTTATGGTGIPESPTPMTNSVGNTSYWVSEMTEDGESERTRIDVIVSALPTAPSIATLEPYCLGTMSSVEDLTSKVTASSGATLKWYTSTTATSGVASPTTPYTFAARTISWFVSQVQGQCESPRAELKVKVLAGPKFVAAISDPVACGEYGKISLQNLLPNTAYEVSYETVPAQKFISNAAGEIENFFPPGVYGLIKVSDFTCSTTDDRNYKISDHEPPLFSVATKQPKTCGGLGAIILKELRANTKYTVSYNDLAGQTYTSVADSIVISLPQGRYSNIKVTWGTCSTSTSETYELNDPTAQPPVALVSKFSFCQNQDVDVRVIKSKIKADANSNLRWYTSQDGVAYEEPLVNNAAPGLQDIWVGQTNALNCSSDKVLITIQINSSSSGDCDRGPITSTDEMSESAVENLVNLLPNPCNGNFKINLPSTISINFIKVSNINGTEVRFHHDYLSNTVSLPESLDGVYLVEFDTNKGFFNKRIIVSR